MDRKSTIVGRKYVFPSYPDYYLRLHKSFPAKEASLGKDDNSKEGPKILVFELFR